MSEELAGTRTEADLMDLNGDGLPDRLHMFDDYSLLEVRLNNGASFDAPQSWQLRDQGRLIRYAREEDTLYDLIDMNGDGRADRVKKPAEGTELLVHLNSGSDFEFTARTWTNDSDTSRIRRSLSDHSSISATSGLIDLNGDGLADRVDAEEGSLSVRLNLGCATEY